MFPVYSQIPRGVFLIWSQIPRGVSFILENVPHLSPSPTMNERMKNPPSKCGCRLETSGNLEEPRLHGNRG